MVGKIDALYIPTDNLLASNMPTVSMVANQAKIPTICGESGMVENGGLITNGITVSYTHLDVYKRQDSGCPETYGFRNRRPCKSGCSSAHRQG